MPHSSGGGSHSGGTHGGGGSHGGSRGGSGHYMSSRPFAHAKRYRYYDHRGTERYIYSHGKPTPQSPLILVLTLIFMLPFVIGGLTITLTAFASFRPLKPLTPQYTENGTHISDKIKAIDNKSELESSLNKFEDLTGICPYIMTVYDSDWNESFDSLEDYAFSLYTDKFYDEQHFLIVYSEPKNASKYDYVDWSWEAIQGDYTDSILTNAHFIVFREDLHEKLSDESLSVGEAFNAAFSNSLGYMMNKSEEYSGVVFAILFALVWNTIIWVVIINTIKKYIQSHREYTEVPEVDSSYGNVDSWDL